MVAVVIIYKKLELVTILLVLALVFVVVLQDHLNTEIQHLVRIVVAEDLVLALVLPELLNLKIKLVVIVELRAEQ